MLLFIYNNVYEFKKNKINTIKINTIKINRKIIKSIISNNNLKYLLYE